MKTAIDILMVGDTPGFVAKIRRSLRRAGLSFHIKQVKARESLLHELRRHRPDAILSDYVLSSFHRFRALAIARQIRPDVPFVFVIKSNDEEPSDEIWQAGANDDILKSSLSALAPTLRGALREARERTRLRDMELAVLTSRWTAR